jgi:Putative Ig domain
MQKLLHHYSWLKLASVALFSVFLLACNAGGGGNAAGAAATNSAALYDVSLAGSVGDGPVTGAIVEVWSAQGRLLSTLSSDNTASFNARLRVSRSNYPLLLKVTGGVDLVTGNAPDFQMTSVVTGRGSSRVNINPFSTLIVDIAQSLPGGLTTGNVVTATNIVTGQLGFGLDPALLADPILTTISNTNIANLVKASEALGEMVRRTRDQLATAGQPVSGDDVMAALAADLQDGRLDGAGASGASAKLAATAKVVSGQVLVEAMSNNLKVGGIIATMVIDQAIVTTRPLIGAEGLTQNVAITADMLQQTLDALAAAAVLDSSSEVAALRQAVGRVAAGALPGDVATAVPADASRALDNATLLAPTVNATQMAAINASGRSGATAPDIGTPTAPVTTSPVTTSPDTTGSTSTGTQRKSRHHSGSWSSGTVTTTPTPVSTTPAPTPPVTTPPVTSPPVPVAPANHAPVISGTPGTSVQAGTAYRFQPVATDEDANTTLQFSISGRPAWASFSTRNGTLSGTPADSDAATYRNIIISVTDGTATVALPAFNLVVNPAPAATAPSTSGTLDLSWTAPTTRSDGTPISLAEISGYRIYYGSRSGTYNTPVNVNDGSVQTTTLTGLAPGSWFLVMTTVDTNGLESAYSPEVVKVVN